MKRSEQEITKQKWPALREARQSVFNAHYELTLANIKNPDGSTIKDVEMIFRSLTDAKRRLDILLRIAGQ